MKISEILKDTQQEVYINLKNFKRKVSARKKGKCEKRISLKNRSRKIDIGNISVEELMSNRYYRRGHGGAIKQVR